MMENVFAPSAGINTAVGGAWVSIVHSPVMGVKGSSNRTAGKGVYQVPGLQEMLQREAATMGKVPSPLKIQGLWNLLLDSHSKKDKAYLWNGFSAGFQILWEDMRCHFGAENLKSTKALSILGKQK